MILTSFEGVVHRANAPAYMPTANSFAGSMKSPGRFNRRGEPALYTGLAFETAYHEYQQGETPPRPVLLVAMRVKLRKVVDFRAGPQPSIYQGDWDGALAREWRVEVALLKARKQKVDFAGWRCGGHARKAGACGILYPSARHPGGAALVLFPDAVQWGDELQHLDARSDIQTALDALAPS